jgi:type VII secretion integral membrane protein EccD
VRAPPVYCRLTVLTPGSRADVALPVDVPVADLVPMLMELLGEQGDPGRPVPWRLTGPTGGAPAPGATLDDIGVLDGELLRLGPAAPPPPAPVFDDPVDALAALTAPSAAARRPGRPGGGMIVPAVAVPVGALLLAGATPTGYAWTAGALAGAAALAAIVWTALLGRRANGRDDDPPTSRAAALVPALCAVPLAAAAGWAALPGPPSAASLLAAAVAAGTAAALAQVAARAVVPTLVGAGVVAVLTAAAAVARLQFDVAVPVIAAVVAAAALCTGPVLPRVTLRLSGLPRPVVATDAAGLVAADTGPDVLPPTELAARARLAQAQLAGLSGGFAVVAATAAPLAATGGWAGWTGPALAAAVAAVLLLRARGFADPTIARVHLSTGSAAGAALVGLGAVAAGPAGRLGGALILLGAAGITIATAGATATGSPVARRAVELVEGVLAAAVVPLALAAAGVFALVRGL